MIRIAIAITLACATAAQPSNPLEQFAGEWEFTTLRFEGAQRDYFRVTIEVQGGKLAGVTSRKMKLEGLAQGANIEFRAFDKEGKEQGTLTGRILNGELNGEAAFEEGKERFQWTARRVVRPPAGGPRTHQFTPEKFHNYFSSKIAPALHVFPGDTVETRSVDAGGVDEKGVRRSPGGNPLTGPFYIEGAMPGDTLVVRINRLRLNRDSAQSGASIVASALSPYYFRDLKSEEKFSSEWTLDRDRGVARLTKPTDRLKNFRVHLKPMLGCIGVAPPQDQAFRSGFLGAWGGNMDYNQFGEGATLYLPVFQPGALLFIGDGHAAQGDGELTGDALETSTEYSVTVDIVRDKRPPAPRAENPEYRMASGIGHSLGEALQQATTSLAQWLADDYKLSANEVAIVLGTSIRYDIAEVVDPEIHVVAKIQKSVLAQL